MKNKLYPCSVKFYKELQQLASKIDTNKVGEPAFRMVLTAVGEKAFQMQDGTLVVPIGGLKP